MIFGVILEFFATVSYISSHCINPLLALSLRSINKDEQPRTLIKKILQRNNQCGNHDQITGKLHLDAGKGELILK